MRRVQVETLDGDTIIVLEPETDAERRELERRTDLAVGGIDPRDEDPLDDDGNYVNA